MTVEKTLTVQSGYPWLFGWLALMAGSIGLIIGGAQEGGTGPDVVMIWLGIFGIVGSIIGLAGLFTVNPNEARVVQLFGAYVGTVRDVGFHWANPFYSKHRISLRVRNFETGTTRTPELKDASGHVTESAKTSWRPSKVNDKDGNPIEIAAVVVWRVINTAQAMFAVDDYEDYVHVQSEAALRHLASQYHYDSDTEDAVTLRGNTGQVAHQLKEELQDRLKESGVEVLEARISHLAYAPEIASAMLQRQQASAVIAARTKIVEGAVGMIEMALERLKQQNVIELDAERKANMVSNLLVVLCSDRSATPVINTGSLY